MRSDPRQEMGIQVETPEAPLELMEAERCRSGNDGGSLDIGLIATLPGGGKVIVGELWASGVGEGGARISIDPLPLAQAIVKALTP